MAKTKVFKDIEVNESDFPMSTIGKIISKIKLGKADEVPIVDLVAATTLLANYVKGYKTAQGQEVPGLLFYLKELETRIENTSMADIKSELIESGLIESGEEPRIKIIGMGHEDGTYNDDICIKIAEKESTEVNVDQEAIASLGDILNPKYVQVVKKTLWTDIKKDFKAGTATDEVSPFCHTTTTKTTKATVTREAK